MTARDDQQLLHDYARTGDREVLGRLVSQHIGFVYSAALRQTGDAHLAEDVTQAVFVILAQKASTMRAGASPLGWLFNTTRHVSSNAMKMEARRRYHERQASRLRQPSGDAGLAWEQLAPALDAALARLSERDRGALLLRFFEQMSLKEVASASGISEPAAKKRVTRALERLRGAFAATGMTLSVEALATGLATQAAGTVPPELATAVTNAAVEGMDGAAGTLAPLVKATLRATLRAKLRTAAIACIGVGLVSGLAVVVRQAVTASAVPAPVAQSATAPASSPQPAAQVYRLDDGQVLKLVPPPYPPGRNQLAAQMRGAATTDGRSFHWRDGRLTVWGTFPGGQTRLSTILWAVFAWQSYDFRIPPALATLALPGDWIIREDASPQQLARALADILRERTGTAVGLRRWYADREVVVARGRYRFPAAGTTSPALLHVFSDRNDEVAWTNQGNLSQLLKLVGADAGRRILDETDDPPQGKLTWAVHRSAFLNHGDGRPVDTAKLDQLLAHLTEQTSLTFTRERRRVDLWIVEPAGTPSATAGRVYVGGYVRRQGDYRLSAQLMTLKELIASAGMALPPEQTHIRLHRGELDAGKGVSRTLELDWTDLADGTADDVLLADADVLSVNPNTLGPVVERTLGGPSHDSGQFMDLDGDRVLSSPADLDPADGRELRQWLIKNAVDLMVGSRSGKPQLLGCDIVLAVTKPEQLEQTSARSIRQQLETAEGTPGIVRIPTNSGSTVTFLFRTSSLRVGVLQIIPASNTDEIRIRYRVSP